MYLSNGSSVEVINHGVPLSNTNAVYFPFSETQETQGPREFCSLKAVKNDRYNYEGTWKFIFSKTEFRYDRAR